MTAVDLTAVELADAWIDGDDAARWRSASAHTDEHGARRSGSSLIELAPGRRLPRHTDSAEEVIVVLAGAAEVTVGDRRLEVSGPGVALVPEGVPHEVRNAGDRTLAFLAIYAATDVVTRYEQPVQPAGERERSPLG